MSTSILIDGISTSDTTGVGPWIKIPPQTSLTFMYNIDDSTNSTTKEWFIIESHQITSLYPTQPDS